MSTSKIDVRICVPVHTVADITPACRESLYALADAEYRWGISAGIYISDNRNKGITDSNKIRQTTFPFEAIFFIDSDISFTVEQFERILSIDGDIVSGAYKYRKISVHEPTDFVAGMWNPQDFRQSRLIPCDSTGCREVGWVGGGFLKVTARALSRMQYPYFHHEVIRMGDEAWEMKEDLCFCRNAMRAGVPILLDCDCQVGHGL